MKTKPNKITWKLSHFMIYKLVFYVVWGKGGLVDSQLFALGMHLI
jgi:hypothetical protein